MTTLEQALFDWAKAQSGLEDQNILWSGQPGDINRPDGLFVTLRISDTKRISQHPTIEQTDETEPEPGADIRLSYRNVRSLVLSVSCFGGTLLDVTGARGLAEKLQDSFSLDGVRSAFNGAGLTCFDVGSILSLPELVGADFEARAVFEASFYYNTVVSEHVASIETVEITNENNNSTIVVERG